MSGRSSVTLPTWRARTGSSEEASRTRGAGDVRPPCTWATSHECTLGDSTWPEAITHLATHAARRYRLTDRGLVRRGLVADLAVLDRLAVTDRSTYAAGRTLAEGVRHVIDDGVLALEDGKCRNSTG